MSAPTPLDLAKARLEVMEGYGQQSRYLIQVAAADLGVRSWGGDESVSAKAKREVASHEHCLAAVRLDKAIQFRDEAAAEVAKLEKDLGVVGACQPCGKPATTRWAGMPLCQDCLRVAAKAEDPGAH